MFRVYDYTDASRLFGQDFLTAAVRPPKPGPKVEPEEQEHTIQVQGIEVRVTPAGRYIVTEVDGKAMPVTVEEYRQRLAAQLVAQAPSLKAFRETWVTPPRRRDLLAALPDGGRSPFLVRDLAGMESYDLYDVLAELGYGLAPRTRAGRADAFAYKHTSWLGGMSKSAAAVLRALAAQFARAGTDGLENPAVFQTPQVVAAGGLAALKAQGSPAEVLVETKKRMFAV
jgi:type I restriction enzyme R subunit